MKNHLIQSIIISFWLCAIFFISCQKLDPVAVTKFCSPENVTGITHNSAIIKGEFMDINDDIASYGHCWATTTNPTINNFKTTISGKPQKQVEFTSELKGLISATKYYVRTYATSASGTFYGEEVSFSTIIGVSAVTSNPVINIALITADGGGIVTDDGGSAVIQRGVCWNTTINPTIANAHTSNGSGIGQFASTITGLIENTTYFLRAYATNSLGTSYGENIEFKTVNQFYIVGTFNDWNVHGLYMEKMGNGIYVAYQYLNTSAKFKFITTRDSWINNWGTQGINCGTAGIALPGGEDICASNQSGYAGDGFYEIKLDGINKTLVLTLISTIGVIGDAQAGGWNTDEKLTFNPVSKVWQGHVPFLAGGEYFFRANNAWDIGFKGQLTNLSTNPSASQIITPGVGPYYIVLNLSGPSSFNATLTPPVNDIDGNTYKVTWIGSQTWMAENLKTTHYSDGTAISLITDNIAWNNLGDNNTDKAYCYYNNIIGNKNIYGNLYTWAAAMNGAESSNTTPGGVQGACPAGWHLPSDNEWKELEIFLGLSSSDANLIGWHGTDQGGKLKAPGTIEAGTGLWKTPNEGATDIYGFHALPGGLRAVGEFYILGEYSIYFSSTENSGNQVLVHVMGSGSAGISREIHDKSDGKSVRCIKD